MTLSIEGGDEVDDGVGEEGNDILGPPDVFFSVINSNVKGENLHETPLSVKVSSDRTRSGIARCRTGGKRIQFGLDSCYGSTKFQKQLGNGLHFESI